MNKRKLGSEFEQQACDYLEKKGIRVVARNYRKRIGEIDIIARDGEYLVFTEVKYRMSTDQGGAAYAISERKKQTIRRVAQWYMVENDISMETFCRFDAILIDNGIITHIKNAW